MQPRQVNARREGSRRTLNFSFTFRARAACCFAMAGSVWERATADSVRSLTREAALSLGLRELTAAAGAGRS